MRARLADERGQSLVELLVVLALGVVLVTAVLVTFSQFNSTASRTDALVQVEDQARSQLDRLTRDLRGAVPVAAGGSAVLVPAPSSGTGTVTSNEVVFGRVVDGSAGATSVALRRYCVGGGTLWREDLAGTTATAGAACPSTPGAQRLVPGTPLASMSGTAFSLDPSSSAIGIRLPLTATTGPNRTATLPIRTAVRVRSSLPQAGTLTPGQVTQTCQGSGRALISLGAGVPTNAIASTISVGGQLVGGSSAVVKATTGTAIDVTLTTAGGLVQTVRTALVACP